MPKIKPPTVNFGELSLGGMVAAAQHKAKPTIACFDKELTVSVPGLVDVSSGAWDKGMGCWGIVSFSFSPQEATPPAQLPTHCDRCAIERMSFEQYDDQVHFRFYPTERRVHGDDLGWVVGLRPCPEDPKSAELAFMRVWHDQVLVRFKFKYLQQFKDVFRNAAKDWNL